MTLAGHCAACHNSKCRTSSPDAHSKCLYKHSACRVCGACACCLRGLRAGIARFLDIVPAPVLASLVGVGLGCWPAAKAALFGPRAPLGFLTNALDVLAAATVPAMSFTLGAVCAQPGIC